MNDDYKSIHGFDLELIGQYFAGLKRQRPGSPEVKIKTLNFMD